MMKNEQPPAPLQAAIIFDMDGTIIDVRDFLVHIDAGDRHLTAYHHATVAAPANAKVMALLRQTIEAGIYPVIITARGERWRELTHFTISERGFHAETLLMRAEGDWREDSIIKSEILAEVRKRWNIVAAIDDNPRVVALWESEAIPTISVPSVYTNGDPNDMIVPAWWEEVIARNAKQPATG